MCVPLSPPLVFHVSSLQAQTKFSFCVCVHEVIVLRLCECVPSFNDPLTSSFLVFLPFVVLCMCLVAVDLPHERIYSDFEDPHAQDGAAPVPVATGSVPGRGAPHEPQREGRFRTEVFASTDAPQSNPVRRSLPTRETLKRAQEEAEAESYRRLRQSMGLEASAPPKDASASSEGGRPFRRNPHMASDDFAVERFKRMMRNRL